jgi:prepilin-type processing-associated H-X9-DG protein
LASIRFGDQHGFVPGWRNAGPNEADPPGQNTVSWPVVLLPYLERTDIYRKWASGDPVSPQVSVFICPSSPPDTAGDPTLSYAGNVGSGANARKWDGVMLDTSDEKLGRMGLDEIAAADGTTQTCLITERCGSGGQRPLHQYWWDRRGLTVPDDSDGFFENVAAYMASGPSPRPGIGITGRPIPGMKVINNTTIDSAPGFWSQPSSNHAGGVVMSFCDGHTVFVLDSIDAAVYAQLLSSDSKKATEMSRVDWAANSHPVLTDSDYK